MLEKITIYFYRRNFGYKSSWREEGLYQQIMVEKPHAYGQNDVVQFIEGQGLQESGDTRDEEGLGHGEGIAENNQVDHDKTGKAAGQGFAAGIGELDAGKAVAGYAGYAVAKGKGENGDAGYGQGEED